MTEDDTDGLINEMAHAAYKLIPDAILDRLDADERSDLLVGIDDALAQILRKIAASTRQSQDGDEAPSLRPSTIGAFVTELIEAHMEKCESAGLRPDDRPPHIVSGVSDARANITGVAVASDDGEARIYILLDDGEAFRLTIKPVEGL
jgi:hypothetical protein